MKAKGQIQLVTFLIGKNSLLIKKQGGRDGDFKYTNDDFRCFEIVGCNRLELVGCVAAIHYSVCGSFIWFVASRTYENDAYS